MSKALSSENHRQNPTMIEEFFGQKCFSFQFSLKRAVTKVIKKFEIIWNNFHDVIYVRQKKIER